MDQISEHESKTEMADEFVGTTVLDRFQILARLGAGGMSTVYKAHDLLLDRDVALKFLHDNLLGNSTNRERFRREAIAISALDHPGILKVFSYGECRGREYIAMDFIEGVSLDHLLDNKGALSAAEAVRIIMQAARALGHAHEKGIVHRDVKPSNIMLVGEPGKEAVKIVDFGIAKIDDSAGAQKLTRTHALIGTPHYMSPEQCANQAVDARSDVYSLGCVLFQCLTGNVPFSGDSAFAVAMAHLQEPLPQLPADSPAWLSDVLQRATAKQAADRFETMEEFAAALQAEKVFAPAVRRTPRQGPSFRFDKRAVFGWLAVLAIALLAILGNFAYTQYEHERSMQRKDGPPTAESELRLAESLLEQGQYTKAQVHAYEARLLAGKNMDSDITRRITTLVDRSRPPHGDSNLYIDLLTASPEYERGQNTQDPLQKEAAFERSHSAWHQIDVDGIEVGPKTAEQKADLLRAMNAVYYQRGKVSAAANTDVELVNLERRYRPNCADFALAEALYARDLNLLGKPESQQHADSALHLLAAVNPTGIKLEQAVLWGVVGSSLGQYYEQRGQGNTAYGVFRKTQSICQVIGHTADIVGMRHWCGDSLCRLNLYNSGLTEMMAVVKYAESRGDMPAVFDEYVQMGNLAMGMNNRDVPGLYYAAALQIAPQCTTSHYYHAFLWQAYFSLGRLYAEKHQSERAERFTKAAVSQVTRFGDPASIASMCAFAADTEGLIGNEETRCTYLRLARQTGSVH